MRKLVVRNSRWKHLALSVLLLLTGVFFLFPFFGETSNQRFISWIVGFLFFLGSLFLFFRAFLSKPRIIIDSEGIWANTFFVDKVFWEDIEEVSVNNGMIALKVKDKEKYFPDKSTKFYKRALLIDFYLTDVKSSEILQAINIELNNRI